MRIAVTLSFSRRLQSLDDFLEMRRRRERFRDERCAKSVPSAYSL